MRLLDSPKFDCLGEPYLLRPPFHPPPLRSHQTGASGSKRPYCDSDTESETEVYQVDLTMDLSRDGDYDSEASQGNEEDKTEKDLTQEEEEEEDEDPLDVPVMLSQDMVNFY